MRRRRAILAILCLCVLAVFGRIAAHEFTEWDDRSTIWGNPRLNPPTLQNTLWYWRHAEMSIYIPLTRTVWAVLAAVGRVQTPGQGASINPWVFHAASVLLHMATACVVFVVLTRLVGGRHGGTEARRHGGTKAMGNDEVRSPKPQRMTNGEIRRQTGNWQPATGNSAPIENRKSKIENVPPWPALAGTLLFALHPVQVEPVAWASGMKDLLWGLFAMIALWQYIQFAAPDAGVPASRRKLHYGLALLAFLLAVLSKPTAVIVPLILGIVDYWALRRPARQVLANLGPWLIVSAAFAIVARTVQTAEGVPLTPVWTRPLIAGDALAFYLYKLLWPVGLTVDYGRRPTIVMQQAWVYVAWVVPAAVFVVLWLARRRAPLVFVGGLIFVAALLPVLGFVPFLFQYYSTVADHYLYVAMLGPALGLAWGLSAVRQAVWHIATACALVMLACLSFIEAGYWRSSLDLWQRAVAVNPDSFLAHASLGNALVPADLPRAMQHWRRALEINPDHQPPRTMLAGAHAALGQLALERGQTEQAIRHFQEALRLIPDHPSAAAGLAAAQRGQ
mgnify:CR=1 FL=1